MNFPPRRTPYVHHVPFLYIRTGGGEVCTPNHHLQYEHVCSIANHGFCRNTYPGRDLHPHAPLVNHKLNRTNAGYVVRGNLHPSTTHKPFALRPCVSERQRRAMEGEAGTSLNSICLRSLKRTHDMYLSNYGQRPALLEAGSVLAYPSE